MDLCSCAFKNDITQAAILLESGANANEFVSWNSKLGSKSPSDPPVTWNQNQHHMPDIYRTLPLHVASMQGHVEFVQLLLNNHASVSKKDSLGR